MMRILVIGGGKLGTVVIKQLKKNPDVKIVVADWRRDCVAVEKKVIDKIDIHAHITPMNFKTVIEKVRPDLVLVARSAKDWRYEDSPMGSHLVQGMEKQMLTQKVPVILVGALMGNV